VVVIVDARVLFQRLRAIRGGLAQAPIMHAIGLRLIGWVAKNFEAEGLETKWRPLSPNTIAGRRKASSKPLQDKGLLRASWTTARGNPKVVGDTVSVTSNVKYAPYHEFGSGPFTIRPKTAKRLAFMTAGGMRFAKEIHHPGIPKRQMTPSKPLAHELAVSTLTAAVNKATQAARK
jgi:phage gpG-like protein